MTESVKTEKLLLQKDRPIGWITFNQPEKRNAVSQEMWQAMPEYVADLSADDSIRVVILRGAGEQAFVAGADISQFKDRRRNAADEEEYRRISGAGQQSLANLRKPLPLTTLAELAERLPSVFALLEDGMWSKAAEEELLRLLL